MNKAGWWIATLVRLCRSTRVMSDMAPVKGLGRRQAYMTAEASFVLAEWSLEAPRIKWLLQRTDCRDESSDCPRVTVVE